MNSAGVTQQEGSRFGPWVEQNFVASSVIEVARLMLSLKLYLLLLFPPTKSATSLSEN